MQALPTPTPSDPSLPQTLTNKLKGLSKMLGEFLCPCVSDCYSLVLKLLILLVVVGTLCRHVENVLHSKLL